MSSSHSAATATLLLSCRDRKGLVAALAKLLYDHGANILDADQHTDPVAGQFFQRIKFDMSELHTDRRSLEQAVAELEKSGQAAQTRFWQMLSVVQRVVDMGGHNHMFSFFPEEGSLMDHLPATPRDQWRRVQLARYLIDYRGVRVVAGEPVCPGGRLAAGPGRGQSGNSGRRRQSAPRLSPDGLSAPGRRPDCRHGRLAGRPGPWSIGRSAGPLAVCDDRMRPVFVPLRR